MPSTPQPLPDSTPDVAALLDERYGRNTSKSNHRLWRILLVLGGVIFVSTAIWAAYNLSHSDVSWQDRGYSVHSDHDMTVFFSVTMDPGTSARCTIEALNINYAQVGIIEVDIPASDERTTVHSAQLATQELAVTGVVNTCVVR